jgi:group I intron endonuclease
MEHGKLNWYFDYTFNGKQHSRTRNVIYKIENTLSGKLYIGQTKRMLFERWRDYKYDLLRPIQVKKRSGANIKLKRSVQYYFKQIGNVEFLRFSIVEIVDCSNVDPRSLEDFLGEKERYHIKELRKKHGNMVCNVLDGGTVRVFNDNGKQNISEAKKRFYQTEKGEALKEKLRNIQTGHTISEETRKKLSESHKGLLAGDKHPLFGKTGELSSTYGMKHKQESIRKMKQNRKGKCSGMDNHNAKIYDLSDRPLVSNTGELYRQIVCLSAFCKLHALHPTHLRNVISGKNKSHKGWKLEDH